MNHSIIAFLIIIIGGASLLKEIEAFVSFNNQSTFDVFGEDFHYNYLSDYYEEDTDENTSLDLHALQSYDDDSFYDEVIQRKDHINDSLLDYENNRPKRSTQRKSKGLRYGIELKCDKDKECHEWVNQRHFCVIGRCIQLFCENHKDCPRKSQCYDGLCIVVTSCKHTEDCQDGLVCLNGKCSPDDDDSGSEECGVGCECQDDKDCAPGLTCLDGRCDNDDYCEKDSDCHNQNEICKFGLCADGGCVKDSDCEQPGRVCRNRRCFIQCSQVHGSCPPGLICAQNSICIQGKCKEDSDCGSPAFCVDGLCNLDCLRDSDCPRGLICQNSRCKACQGDEDCTQPGSRCRNGKCSQGECDDQEDCPELHQACINGKCKDESCLKNKDCYNGTVCRSDRCQKCVNTQECTYGRICNELGQCVIQDNFCQSSMDCLRNFCCITGQCLRSCSRQTTDCNDNQDCYQGFCRDLCKRNQDCPRGICHPRHDVCIEDFIDPRSSSSSSRLISDTTCQVPIKSGCQKDVDCYFGQYCDVEDGQCKYRSCRRHRGCSGRQRCRGGDCIPVCNRRSPCRKREDICFQHRCYKRCQEDDDCPSDQFTCHRPTGRCLHHDDCGEAEFNCNRRREFCERGANCIEKCRNPNDCPRGMNCIDGGCRQYRCFQRKDCTGHRAVCSRYGRCQRRRRQRQRPGGRRPGGGFTVVSTHSQNNFLGRPNPKDGFKLVRGTGPTNIPQNIPCPFYTRNSDQFGPIKCQRILCRCNNASDCAPYKPHWSKGPLICCAGACVLGQPDNCQRDSRVCR